MFRDALVDIWRTLVPPPGDRHGPLAPLIVLLTGVSGLVDGFSYLVEGHVFVANMTGNVVFLGLALAGVKGFAIGVPILAIAAFVGGAAFGGRLIVRLGTNRGRLLAGAAAVEAVLFAAAAITSWTCDDPGRGVQRYLIIALLSMGLGLQNAAARRVAVPELTSTVLTMTLTGIASDAQTGGPGAMRFGRRLLATSVILLGAFVSALMIINGAARPTVVLAGILLMGVAVTAGTLSRSDPDWSRPLN